MVIRSEGKAIRSAGFVRRCFEEAFFLGVSVSPWMCYGKHESFREEGSRKSAL